MLFPYRCAYAIRILYIEIKPVLVLYIICTYLTAIGSESHRAAAGERGGGGGGGGGVSGVTYPGPQGTIGAPRYDTGGPAGRSISRGTPPPPHSYFQGPQMICYPGPHYGSYRPWNHIMLYESARFKKSSSNTLCATCYVFITLQAQRNEEFVLNV